MRQACSSLALLSLIAVSLFQCSHSFSSTVVSKTTISKSDSLLLRTADSGDNEHFGIFESRSGVGAIQTRREILSKAAAGFLAAATATTALPSIALASPEEDVKETRALIVEAKTQLESVPPLLKEEKWDSVRTVLMEAPLRDCWSKSTPILKKYAEALGETPKGDELAALEGREELLQQLRFLDMAVYNNVFNPISTEGKTGASKTLIDSYYNDPTRAFDASMKAINGLIELSN